MKKFRKVIKKQTKKLIQYSTNTKNLPKSVKKNEMYSKCAKQIIKIIENLPKFWKNWPKIWEKIDKIVKKYRKFKKFAKCVKKPNFTQNLQTEKIVINHWKLTYICKKIW